LYEAITFYTETNKIIDHLILNIFYVIELFLIAAFFYQIILGTFFKKLILFLVIIFLGITVFTFGIEKDVFKVNELVKTSSALIIIGFSIFYFIELIQNFEPKTLLKDGTFIIVSGMFFYFCALFVFALFSRDVMWGEHTMALKIYTVIMLFTIIYRIVLTIGIWKLESKK
jgi:hypothetical protein